MRLIVGFMMVVFVLAGVLIVVSASRELLRRLLSYRRFERAEGIVVGVHRKVMMGMSGMHSRPTIMNFPVIAFSHHTGQAVTFTSAVGDGGRVSHYKIGQRLCVRYDPHGEFEPMLDSWSGVWLPNIMYVVAGGVFLGGGYLIYWAFWDRILGH